MAPVKTLLLSFVVVVSLSACGLWVATDYDTNVAFNQLHYFQWLPRPPAVNEDPRLYNNLMDERMQRIITAEMSARGYANTTSTPPDMLVTYHLMEEIREDSYGPSFGGAVGFGGGNSALMLGGGTHVHSYEQTEVIIDILDPKTHNLLWRGSAKQPYLNDRDPAAIDAEITHVVQAILAKFPPP